MIIDKDDYIDGDKFESLSDLSFGDCYTNYKDFDINFLNDFIINFKQDRLPIIFVDSERVKNFFDLTKEYDKSFILLSHNGDYTFNEDDIKLKPKCIQKWYGQNINVKNSDDIISLPIGLERSHWSKIRYGKYGFKHDKLFEYSKKEVIKKNLCYINFNINTNKQKREWIPSFFNNFDWCNIMMGGINGSLDVYFNDCLNSHFILCPEGNGIDCHRNWEILYLGRIPIVEDNYFVNEIYGDLPVIIVDDFKNINKDILLEYINHFENFHFNNDKLKFSYWKKIIKP
jgi:hypothetical protein